jgi:flagellar motor switch protein FliM
MPDLLDQSEVDALLATVDQGAVKGETVPKVFSREKRLGEVEIKPYDFKRPERVSKDQMRALEALHEGFARNFGAALSGYLRTIVEISVANIEQLTFSEFIHALPNPTCFNLLSAKPLDGQMCLEISPLIVYPIIDRLLGGSNADLFIPQRPLTQIEWRLVKRMTDRALATLSEAWGNVTPVAFELTETESNPQLVQIVPPNEVVGS